MDRINKSAATFDAEKLDWVNRNHLKLLPPQDLARLAIPYLSRVGWIPDRPSPELMAWLAEVMQAILKYLDRLDQSVDHCRVIFEFQPDQGLLREEVAQVLATEGAWEVIASLADVLERRRNLDSAAYKEAVGTVKAATGRKGRQLFHPIRAALTLQTAGMALDQLVAILETGRRLQLPTPLTGVHERLQAVLAMRP